MTDKDKITVPISRWDVEHTGERMPQVPSGEGEAWQRVRAFVDAMLEDWPGPDDCRFAFGGSRAFVTKGDFKAVQAALTAPPGTVSTLPRQGVDVPEELVQQAFKIYAATVGLESASGLLRAKCSSGLRAVLEALLSPSDAAPDAVGDARHD